MTNPNTHTTTRVRTQYAYKMCLTIFDNAMMYCPFLRKKNRDYFWMKYRRSGEPVLANKL